MSRQDSEPPMVVASRWVHEISSIALEMALPAGVGFWFDRRWGTSPWLVLVGAVFGMAVAGLSFTRLVKRLEQQSKKSASSSLPKSSDNSGSQSE